ncbi:MAG: hypothetical protein OXC96_03900 [Cyanobacteria bacterium MAG CAR1_bin_15]|nr:hypothetical protein [Cyanobacteria bacterium MAG CAR1_bin_15]
MTVTIHQKWHIEEKQSPLDDSTVVMAFNHAVEGKSKFLKPFLLVVRYQSGNLWVFIHWQGDLDFGRGNVEVTYRLPPERAKEEQWHRSKEGKATIYPNPTLFLESLAKSERLVAKLKSGPMAVFDLKGIDIVVERIERSKRGFVEDERGKEEIEPQDKNEKEKIDRQYKEAQQRKPVGGAGEMVYWYIPLQETIDKFDHRIVGDSEFMFELDLFKKMSTAIITNYHSGKRDDSVNTEYFDLYVSLVERYNRILDSQ